MAFFTVIEAFEKFLFVLKWSNQTPTIILICMSVCARRISVTLDCTPLYESGVGDEIFAPMYVPFLHSASAGPRWWRRAQRQVTTI